MAAVKKDLNAVAIDWFADFIARVCPGMLEIIGGGPAGPGGPLANATLAQKKKILVGAKKIVEQATKIVNKVR
jgi:hypothetical protein